MLWTGLFGLVIISSSGLSKSQINQRAVKLTGFPLKPSLKKLIDC